MENKYYVPAIEEFHIGFEYEFKHPDYPDWNKYNTPEFNMDREDCVPFYGDTECLKNFRVKYLDKEDIESLGYASNAKMCFLEEGKMVDDCIFFEKDKINFLFYPKTYKLIIIKDKNNFFDGTIKNKSEFIKLLKQLNIQ